MRQVDIDNVAPGMVLGRTLYAPGEVSGGVPLLAADVVITEVILKRMRKASVSSIVINDEFSLGIDIPQVISNETRENAVITLKSTYQALGKDNGETPLTTQQVQSVESVMSRIITEILARKSFLMSLSDLNIFGGGRMQHALNVCVVGSLVARQFFSKNGWIDFRGQRRDDGIEERLVKLGVGLLLQDIGTLAIPDHIRDKKGILTASERAIAQQHPLLSLEMLEGSEVSPLTKVTIAQHHERYDGSGYPRSLTGDDVHDNGQIAGIAEMYSSLCNSYDDPKNSILPHIAYNLIVQSRGRLFRPEIIDAFVAAIAAYSVGTTVRLQDGRFGIVYANNNEDIENPIVRVTHDPSGEILTIPEEVNTGNGIKIVEVTPGLPGEPTMLKKVRS